MSDVDFEQYFTDNSAYGMQGDYNPFIGDIPDTMMTAEDLIGESGGDAGIYIDGTSIASTDDFGMTSSGLPSTVASTQATPSKSSGSGGNGGRKGRVAAVIEEPIFQLAQVGYDPGKLIDMAVANNVVVMACSGARLAKIDLSAPDRVEEVEVLRRGEQGAANIRRIFMDPTGNHVLISMDNEENFYFHTSSKKPRALQKLKGVSIESVAWDIQNRAPRAVSTTNSILVGTSNGKLYEACFEYSGERRLDFVSAGNKDHLWRLLHHFDDPQPIIGVYYERLSQSAVDAAAVAAAAKAGSNAGAGGGAVGPKYFVVVATAARLYQFAGGPTFDAFIPGEQVPSFQEMPPSPTRRSGLAFFRRPGGAAQSFAWLTGPGIFHGNLASGMSAVQGHVTQDTALVYYREPDQQTMAAAIPQQNALAVLMTEFHYIVLYDDRVSCINRLSEEVVFEEDVPKRPRGLVQDPLLGTLWLFCEGAIFEIVVTDEDRDVWRLLMEKGDWDTAIRYCKDDPHKKNIVWTTQAESLFAADNCKLAAERYALTSVPFEEVALRFINKDRRDALLVYLRRKLEQVPSDAHTQLTVIATWLVEIFLNLLNACDDRLRTIASKRSDAVRALNTPQSPSQSPQLSDSASSQQSSSSSSSKKYLDSLETERLNASTQLEDMEAEFQGFLNSHYNNLDTPTTYDLISSHGRVEDMLYYAQLIGDYGRILSHYVCVNDWKNVLSTLQSLPASRVDLIYKFSPELVAKDPDATVTMWLAQPSIEPKRLFPALVHAPSDAPAIRYLKACVRGGSEDPAIHNYLLSLLAQRACRSGASAADNKELMDFIDAPGAHYDLKYALRLCTKLAKTRACVLIYGKMGLYEEAVDLALNEDLELAKLNASRPDDEVLRRRLWLKIAEHVVKANKDDIRPTMELIKSCDLLKLEDILPFFPNFTKIDNFKRDICASLDDYNLHISALNKEMKASTDAAAVIRHDIAELRNRAALIRATQPCNVCRHSVLTRSFYLFPCKHVFHTDCLLEKIRAIARPERYRKVADIYAAYSKARAIASAATASAASSGGGGGGSGGGAPSSADAARQVQQQVQAAQQLKRQLDAVLGAECPLCGNMMIELIEKPFVPTDDPDIDLWEIEPPK